MPDPWDRPPFPRRGNSERTLYEAIGRALMAWEEVEGAFAHLYSTLSHRLTFRRWGQSPVRRTFELRASRRRLKSYRMPLLLQASVPGS